jgi:oligoendopeptidase F
MNTRRLFTTLLLAGLTMHAANARERKDIPVPLTWDLNAIYASTTDWQAALSRIQSRIPELARFQGHLGDSPAALSEALRAQLELRKELDRVYAYAMFLADQDARNSEHQEMRQKAQQLASDMEAATSYFEPELIGLGAERVHKLVAAEPGLQTYKPIFDDILRGAAHTLTPAEEKVAAQASDLLDAGQNVHSIFTDAEMPYPEVKLSTGEKVKLDAAGYTRYRSVPNRADRLKVFKSFWGRYQQYRRTLATTLYEQIKGHLFDKKVHKFDSALEAALFPNNVPPEVYHQLLRDVHANLPTLHRYLKLRQRLMKLPQLGYEDLYAPIVSGVELTYTPEQAMDLTLKSSAPLGQPYLDALQRAYRERWVDFLPSTGKRSGAYSSGDVYDVHPYQLLNYNGKYEDVSTLAHESGHSLHSYLSNKTQPYGLHSYPIFVAEVASTLNENLLFHYMLDNTKDKRTRMSLLGSYLENMRGTLFRQTMLAEFELRVHEMVEAGEPLTGDNLNKLYLKLLREYYGHDKGVCKIDALYGVEWAYIPHFYYNFYVFQYATSLVASTSLASNILAEQKQGTTTARDAYLKMLSTGASEYPLTQLQRAGVDMRTSKPFAAAMREMNEIMDQMEALEKN